MPRLLGIVTIMVTLIVGCTGGDAEFSDATLSAKPDKHSPNQALIDAANTIYEDEQDARNASPTGEVCLLRGEYKEETVCIPRNRGKNGKCDEQTIITDTREWVIAFARGDVDFNGTVGDRDDAMLATKQLYMKQLDSEPCPAVADITRHYGVTGRGDYDPDGFFTSNDVNLWGDVKRSGTLSFPDPTDRLVCANKCEIINHMSPDYK